MRKKAKTKVLSLLLILVMVLGLAPGTVWAEEGTLEGAGTADDPYLIANAKDLAAFRAVVNGKTSSTDCAKLTADITLSGEWIPFNPSSGSVTEAYAGTFDGDGHMISGLYINATAANQGLFGLINGATIKNLKVEGNVTSSNNYVGGIVGKIQQGAVENCSFSGSVSTTKPRGYAGGIAGYAGNIATQKATISGCVNMGNVTGETNGVVGGIVGYAKYSTIENCYNTGSVNGACYSGGIAGQLQNNCTATNCYNLGTLEGSATASDIAGFLYLSSKLSKCYYINQASGTGTGAVASDCKEITDTDTLLNDLGDPFVADTNNINGGWPVLSWQTGEVPAPRDPKITISGSSTLYMTNSGTQPMGTLTAIYTDMDPVPVQWSITKGGDVISLGDPANVDSNKSTQTVSIKKSGQATVTATAGECSDEIEITVCPFITTVEIDGTVAVGQTIKAKINVYGGEAFDYDTFPVTVTWKYLTAEDYSAGNTGSSSYKTIPGATGPTYTIPEDMAGKYLSFELWYNGEQKTPSHPTEILAQAPEKPGPQPSEPDPKLEEVLRGYTTMYPICGTDTNVNRVLEGYLKGKGFDGYTASVKSVTEVYGGAGIAENGDITYFYADPNTTPSIRMGSYKVTFTLSKDSETLEKEISVILYWDVKKVEEVMRNEILSGVALDTADPVTEDLTLPKAVDGKKWTLISWTSSYEDVISISTNNQTTADTLFDPYVGVVKRGEKDQTVTLTATFTFQLTNDVTGSEPAITLVSTYPVTVKALDEAAKDQIEAELLARLDAGFAKKGLTDAVTGQRLTADENGVYTAANDIQLPTTGDFGVDGKYYPVTITTSDDKILKAPDVNNAARVEVYRPIGTDGEGTITVTLHDRDTSVTVSRTFQIKVSALSQEEIEAELDLMERVKAAYFDGIKGGNEAKDNVRTDLSPFFEVYEQDGELVWIRSNQEKTGQGIVPVPMEGWEDLELWRLFKSSNPNVISHENLIVTRQIQAKAVTITSRLSSETLGRYGELYVNDPVQYSQYAALAPLYYQEVTTDTSSQPETRRMVRVVAQPSADTIVVRGTQNPDSAVPVIETLDNITFSLTGLDGAEWVSASFSGLDEASTVYDVFLKALGSRYTAERVKGTYIKAISGPQGSLAEKEYGEDSGWMYRVNWSIPDVYMGACPLCSGDAIQVFYTRDANKDDPNYSRPSGGNSGTSSGSSSNGGSSNGKIETEHNQTATVERSNREDTYTVTLPKSGSGPQRVTIPNVKQGQLVVIVHADGREEVIKKSILEDSRARFLLEQDANVKVIDYANPFVDIASSAWYSSAVDFVSGRKLFSGVGENIFAPDFSLSRGMLAAVLYRLEEPDAQNTNSLFSDVATGAWYEQGVAWATQAGIVNGYGDGRFGPEDAITREQLAVMLFRYAQLLNMNTAGRDSLTSFSDSGAVSPWAWGAVAWAVDSGIISGLPNGTLAPSGTATRAEAATMLQRFIAVLLR